MSIGPKDRGLQRFMNRFAPMFPSITRLDGALYEKKQYDDSGVVTFGQLTVPNTHEGEESSHA